MGMLVLKEEIAILHDSADHFEELARNTRDHEERTAMELVARAVRSAARYADAAHLAGAQRTRLRSFSLGT